MRRLARQHGVDGLIGQRYRLGATRRRGHAGHPAAQFGQHVRVGLDRHDARLAAVQGQAGQLGGELAGAGAEVENPDRVPGGLVTGSSAHRIAAAG